MLRQKIINIFIIILLFLYKPVYAKQLNIDSFKLKNGLEVILIPNNRAPIVHHSLWYKVGSADSPVNKTGLAHFVEHLMFKGTFKYPGDSFKLIVNKLGGTPDAGTTWDYTNYSITIAKEYLELIMELESDRMVNLTFNPNEVAKELQVVLQERRQRTEANPNQLLNEATNAAFFWQHPYGKPVIGFKHHIESYTPEDAMHFYQNWYAPNNAILVIAGDITKNTVMSLINKYYGNITSKKIPDRTILRTKEPPHNNCTNIVELRNTKFSDNYWGVIYSAPNHNNALILLEFILGEGSFGRLRKNLVDNQKIAFTANAIYSGYMLDPYNFSIYITPVNNIDAIKTQHLVSAEINNLLKDGITNEELIHAKKQYSVYFRFNHDSIISIADFVGSHLVYNYSLEEIKNWLISLQNISVNQVNEAAKLVFNKQPEVISIAQPIIEN